MAVKKPLKIKKGSTIIKTGKVEQRMYIIQEGEVDIVLAHDKKNVSVATLKAGDFFGEISLFSKAPRSADAVARENVLLQCIDNTEELKVYLHENPDFSAKMVQNLTQRLLNMNKMFLKQLGDKGQMELKNFMW